MNEWRRRINNNKIQQQQQQLVAKNSNSTDFRLNSHCFVNWIELIVVVLFSWIQRVSAGGEVNCPTL